MLTYIIISIRERKKNDLMVFWTLINENDMYNALRAHQIQSIGEIISNDPVTFLEGINASKKEVK